MTHDDHLPWERLEVQARRTAAARLVAGQGIDPGGIAREVLRDNMFAVSTEQIARLESYIRRELPAIEVRVAELHHGRAKSRRRRL
jgi:hypothetical protein